MLCIALHTLACAWKNRKQNLQKIHIPLLNLCNAVKFDEINGTKPILFDIHNFVHIFG